MQVAKPGSFREVFFATKNGEEIEAVEVFGWRYACGAEDGGEDVDVADTAFEGLATGESPDGPAESGDDAGSAFVEVELGSTPGSVASSAEDATVVAEEDDEGVVGIGSGIDGVEDLADSSVHRADHGSVGTTLVVFDRGMEGEVFPGGLEGRMRGIEREVEKVGFVLG